MNNNLLKSNALLTCILVVSLCCAEAQVSPLSLASDFAQKYENQNSMSYDVNYKMKFFSENDTINLKARVHMVRIKNDSLFGGCIWIESDSVITYYNTQTIYQINQVQKKVIKFPKSKTSPINGTIIGNTYRSYFLNPKGLLNGVSDTSVDATLVEELVEDTEAWKMIFKFRDAEDVTNKIKRIWISKKDTAVIKMNYNASSQGENQYNQWDFSNVSFSKVSLEDLNKKLSYFLLTYEVEEYKELNKDRQPGIPIGETIPNLHGVIYPKNDSVVFNQYLDKLTIYDFWYLSCPPCIKAIPHLNELYQKYKDKGLKVVGINPYDNSEKGLKRLPDFLVYNPISYPIVFIDLELIELFKIQVYPTFILVNHEGKVLHIETGFNEEKARDLDKQINEYLSK